MANPWFRLYAEFANDAKVQMLSEANQRRLLMLFCFRCNSDVTLHDEEIAFQLRISNDEWSATKAIFISKGFIDSDNNVLNWDKRQFASDTSKNRVAAYRERNKNKSNGTVTLHKQKSNAVDTDTESDTHKPKIIVRSSTSRFLEFWDVWPKSQRKVAKAACEAKWKTKKLDDIADKVIAHVKAMAKTKQWIDGFDPAPMTYINQGRWTDEIFNGEGKSVGNTKPWYISGSGIEAKASELGIKQLNGEIFPDFKVRVYKAAGITPEDVRKANIDFSGMKAA